jgi:hypothetical protein
MKILHRYNFEHHGLSSASLIIDYLAKELKIVPSTVIDIGCGLGQWLYVFQAKLNTSVYGVDGFHVPENDSFISEHHRLRVNLEEYLSSTTIKKYDALLCLEVAEHLDISYSTTFIDKLTSLSDIILFSAAIPGQTGENHVNEQPHGFWLDKFEERGYLILDPFRKKFWNDSRVNWWYAQNLFLICKPSSCSQESMSHNYDRNMYVHPQLLDLYKPAMSDSIADRSLSLYSKVNSIIKRILR